MKVVITHQGGGKDHPYISQLIKALQQLPGVQVIPAAEGKLALWRTARRRGLPDIIHIQWQHPFFLGTRFDKLLLSTLRFFAQVISLRLMGVRFVWTVHELVRFGTVRAKWELWANRRLARLVDRMVVHCETAAAEVAAACRIPVSRLDVVPHGHFVEHYPPAVEKQQARIALGLAPEGKLYLFFGHVKGYKGLDQLAQAFVRLEEPDVTLLIAGKPHPSAAETITLLNQLAGQDSRFQTRFGFIPDEEMALYFSASDLVVLPYTDSLTSGVATLAASYGRPVLMPRLGCMGEYPPEVALLYDPAAPDGLFQALQRSLYAPLGAMGAAAKNHISQYAYSWPYIAREPYRLYQEILPAATPVTPLSPLPLAEELPAQRNPDAS